MLELLLDNKDGNVWDISDLITDISYKTARRGKPSSLSFTLIKSLDTDLSYKNGDIVRLRYNDQNVFYGYIFTIDGGKDEDIKITCYDQIRYLLNADTYVFANKKASEIISQIANDFGLAMGQIEDTEYLIPAMVEDGQKLLDIIDKALALTLINSNGNFVFYDDFGSLALKNIDNLILPFYIGDGSLMHNYKSKSSVDSDTYNRIKLYKDNKKTGKREIYITQDSANISKWGLLQLYQSVDENMNEAQINQLADQLLQLKNRENRSLKLDCIGDIRARAGFYIPVIIEEYGINQPFLIDACNHKISDGEHTMTLDLKVI